MFDVDAGGRLAFYSAWEGAGILAPRGWHCVGIMASDSAFLFVSPSPLSTPDLMGDGALAGPLVTVADIDGRTSGRFEVAKIMARVFPASRPFVQSVIDEGLEPPSAFPFGVPHQDRVRYIDARTVEFETPRNTDGLGTQLLWIKRSDAAIHGVALLRGPEDEPAVIFLSVRLPGEDRALSDAIVRDLERAHPN